MCGKAWRGKVEEGKHLLARRPLCSVAPERPLRQRGGEDKRGKGRGGVKTYPVFGRNRRRGNEGKSLAGGGGNTRGKAG
jgi:hypothetical protein